jgi:hypothetical protein
MSDSYFGGKAGAGVWQTIVNRIPPHDCLIVPFAGHCAVSRFIRPCRRLILCDADPEVCTWWDSRLPDHGEIHHCDGIEFLRFHFGLTARASTDPATPAAAAPAGVDESGGEVLGFPTDRIVVFCDPPYHLETRTSATRYRCDFDAADQVRYLEVATRIPAAVLACGYRHQDLDAAFRDWSRTDYQAMTRGGLRTESLWQNFETTDLHDWRHYGADKREREKLKRRERSIIGKLRAMPGPERRRLLAALADEFSDAAESHQLAASDPPACDRSSA